MQILDSKTIPKPSSNLSLADTPRAEDVHFPYFLENAYSRFQTHYPNWFQDSHGSNGVFYFLI